MSSSSPSTSSAFSTLQILAMCLLLTLFDLNNGSSRSGVKGNNVIDDPGGFGGSRSRVISGDATGGSTLRAPPFCYSLAPLQKGKVDVLIFSKDRPLRLLSLLESQALHVSGASSVTVMFLASTEVRQAAYERVASLFDDVEFVDEAQFGAEPDKPRFQVAVESVLERLSAPYITPIVDEMVWLRATDLAHVADYLDTAAPEGDGTFQLRLGMSYTNVGAANPILQASNGPRSVLSFSWSWELLPRDFAFVTVVDAAVVSAARLRSEWKALRFNHPGELESAWEKFQPSYGKGLHFFYADSSITNVEDPNKVRDDRSHPGHANGLDAAAQKVVDGMHLNISSVTELMPLTGHTGMDMAFLPISKCSAGT